MTTPANDETKKDEITTSAGGTTPKTTDAKDTSDAPKKRKRKRKPKKAVVSETAVGEETKKTTPSHAHTPKKHESHNKEETKEKETKEKETKEEEKSEENKKPNLDIKSDAHMLPGIDDIHDYIARKKATTHAQHKKETLTSGSFLTPEGIDLLTLPGLFALIPHAKGDHKLVYLRTNEPTGLIDDPRNRTPGSMYVKNGRDIYMVALTMKEHPTLKDAHGESYDVWIIDTTDQLIAQLDAIKKGMGGGENFGEPIFIEQTTEQPTESEEVLTTTAVVTAGAEDVPSDIPAEAAIITAAASIIPESGLVESTELIAADSSIALGEQEDISPSEVKPQETSPQELSPLDLPDISPEVDTDVGNIDSIDLTLPIDENIPDSALDIPEDIASTEDAQTTQEQATPTEDPAPISLDGIQVTEEQEASFTLPEATEEMIPSVTVDTTPEEITLDMEKEEPTPEANEGAMLHFATHETTPSYEEIPTEPLEEATTHPLFGAVHEEESTTNTESEEVANKTTEQGAEKSMFTTPSFSTSQEANSDTEHTIPHDEDTTPKEPMFSSPVTIPMIEEIPLPTPEVQPETPLPSETIQQGSSFDLDDLSIESPEGTLDLDAMAQANQPEETQEVAISSTTAVNNSTHTSPKKSSFPIAVVIRIVLFLLIVGALFLVWKVMFPTIKGTKAPDSNTTTTGQQMDDTTDPDDTIDTPTDDGTDPTDNTNDTDPQNTDPDDTIDTPTDDGTDPTDNTNNADPQNTDPDDTPTASLTLNELGEKLKVQQTEARKVLNIAKLLENKQAIKFALAAMLKAGNVLERIDTEPTITAEDVLQESQKIDAYLNEANKLVE